MVMAPAPKTVGNRAIPKAAKIRYFKGKAPEAARSDDEDSDEDEETVTAPQPVRVDKSLVAGGAGRIIPEGGAIKVALRDVKVEGGRVLLPKSVKKGGYTLTRQSSSKLTVGQCRGIRRRR